MAAVFVVLPAVFGVRTDQEIEKFLNSDGVIETFKKNKGRKSSKNQNQISPLVKQAQAFALYLDPPPKPTSTKAAPSRGKQATAPKPEVVSAKFDLIGTSYYQSNPDMSLALIDEPGKGLRWVRQSGQVGHLVFEQIKDGVVIVRDGKRTFELPVVAGPAEISLLDKGPASGKTSFKPALGLSDKTHSRTAARYKPLQVVDEKKVAMVKKFVDDLKTTREGVKAGKAAPEQSDEAKTAMVKKLVSRIRNTRITAEEAKKLDHLGQTLKDVRQDPNRIGNRSAKIQTPSREPNSPAKK